MKKIAISSISRAAKKVPALKNTLMGARNPLFQLQGDIRIPT